MFIEHIRYYFMVMIMYLLICMYTKELKNKLIVNVKFCFWKKHLMIYCLHRRFLAPSRSPRNANVRLFVCSFGENLSRALNLHLSLSGQSQVSLGSL